MEIWILIGILLASGFIGYLGYLGCVASEMNKWMRQRHLRELKLAMHPEFFSRTHDVSADEIRKALDIYKTSGVTTYLPTGEVDVLGPGKVYVFGPPKTGIVTGTVGSSLHSNEELEEMEEAEKLIKEAKEKKID
jgi:hypothetical protein